MARRTRRKLRILFATSEAVPFVKTGGLADVSGSLPFALKEAGAKVAVIMPKYSSIPQSFREKMRHVADFFVPLSWREAYCGIEKLVYEGMDFYFVDNEGYFDRVNPYGEYDDGERFAFFSQAICEAIAQVDELAGDVLHCNDWQTSLAPVYLRELYADKEACAQVKTVMTVHNVRFQGQYTDFMLGDVLGLYGIEDAENQLRCDERSIAYLRGGLNYADVLTTVSPTYAQELQTPEYGEGLDDVFRRRSEALVGVLNGIDTADWDPATDTALPKNYSLAKPAGKAACKKALQEELGLDVDPAAPLVGMVGRLTSQKGLDLVNWIADSLVAHGFQLAVLGTGDGQYEESMRYFDSIHPGRFRAVIGFDDALARRIYAGSDLFLMPSQFEPCGLSQMIAMRYGSLPVVRATGGLRDSVVPYDAQTGEGTGFVFEEFDAMKMESAMLEAAELMETQPKAWAKLVANAMAQDFSWTRSAWSYMDIYHELCPDVIPWKSKEKALS